MAQRCSSASDRSPAVVQQIKGRCNVPGDYNEHPSATNNDDCSNKSCTRNFDSHECGRHDLRENKPMNQSPAGISSQAVGALSSSPLSSKRRHKPNSMYTDDFVFGSTKKAKIQRCKPEPGSKRVVSSTGDLQRALLENETTDSNSEKTVNDAAKNENRKMLPSASDLTLSEGRSCAAKKRGRKPKHCSDISLHVAENAESESLPSNLNLSPRGLSLKLGEKAINIQGRKPHSANISLRYEELRTSSADSFHNQSGVQLTVPRKRGRPPKKPADEMSSNIDKEGAKRNCENSLTENRNIASGISALISKSSANVPCLLDEPSRADLELYSVETELPLSGRRKRCLPKKLSDDYFITASGDAQIPKAEASSGEKLNFANVNLPSEHFSIDVDCSSERTKAALSVPIKCRRPQKSVDENVPKTSKEAIEHHKNSLREDGHVTCGNLLSSQNSSQRTVYPQFGERASMRRRRMSNLANISLSDEQLQTDCDPAALNTMPLTVPRQLSKKLTVKDNTEACEDDANAEVLVNIINLVCL